jgi:hypothetical protein
VISKRKALHGLGDQEDDHPGISIKLDGMNQIWGTTRQLYWQIYALPFDQQANKTILV